MAEERVDAAEEVIATALEAVAVPAVDGEADCWAVEVTMDGEKEVMPAVIMARVKVLLVGVATELAAVVVLEAVAMAVALMEVVEMAAGAKARANLEVEATQDAREAGTMVEATQGKMKVVMMVGVMMVGVMMVGVLEALVTAVVEGDACRPRGIARQRANCAHP